LSSGKRITLEELCASEDINVIDVKQYPTTATAVKKKYMIDFDCPDITTYEAGVKQLHSECERRDSRLAKYASVLIGDPGEGWITLDRNQSYVLREGA
jgi:hypothetical protein